MDTNKNLYTIVYSVVLVVVVAAVLAFAAEALKPKQQRNIEIETKQMILKSVRLAPDALTAPDKAKYIEDQYSKYIKDSSITTEQGDKKLYICTFENGEKAYIVYVSGVGLWGPIWGYVAFKNDFNTIYGTTFDHKGETPGLGAEINTDWFAAQFNDKQIFENGEFTSVKVVKGGADKSNPHEVDAISGGTITSKALEAMLLNSLKNYTTFFKAKLDEANAQKQVQADSVAVKSDSLNTSIK